ncbi:MAG: hypothetical protein V1792_03610 [Pseudomonadota bacterium]
MPPELQGQSFQNGLVLIYASRFPLPANPEKETIPTHTGPFSGTFVVDVPTTTKYVHIAVEAVSMSFGTPAGTAPDQLARIGFEVKNRDDSNAQLAQGKYKFDLKALLQNGPQHTPTGKWTFIFWMEMLCFGEIPK